MRTRRAELMAAKATTSNAAEAGSGMALALPIQRLLAVKLPSEGAVNWTPVMMGLKAELPSAVSIHEKLGEVKSPTEAPLAKNEAWSALAAAALPESLPTTM